MKFTIENGTNICTIALSELGSYIEFDYPLTVVWEDCGGSIAKYFCVLPYNKNYRETVERSFIDGLSEDYSGKVDELYELLKPLFPLFKNGNYNLGFYSNRAREFFEYTSSTDNFSAIRYDEFAVIFAERTTELKNIEDIRTEHSNFLKENEITKERYPSNILGYTTDWIYETSKSFYATQPIERLNPERVRYFEEKIKKGERPFAVLFNAELFSAAISSSYFILDGHHKLSAYQNLEIYPPIALITYLPESIQETNFDPEKLATVLFPWQTEHILDHLPGKNEYLNNVMSDPNSILHSIVRNGDYEDYYENGQLKHKAFYKNGAAEGLSKYWFETGQLKQETFYYSGTPDGYDRSWYENGKLRSECFYENGMRAGVRKHFFESGNIQFIESFSSTGQLTGTMTSFFENGNKNMEQHLENGKYLDGVSYKVWYENGDMQTAITYRTGEMTERKNWNELGALNHLVLNETSKEMEEVVLSDSEKYDYDSENYKKRLKLIRELEERNRLRRKLKHGEEKMGLWGRIKRFFE